MRNLAVRAALAASLALMMAQYVEAQSQPSQSPPKSERIYGYGMMTDAERNEYREKMRNAKTTQERQAVRDEHHKSMQARMEERGIEPGHMQGRGAGPGGPGMGMGRGMAPGAGQGPGAGPRDPGGHGPHGAPPANTPPKAPSGVEGAKG